MRRIKKLQLAHSFLILLITFVHHYCSRISHSPVSYHIIDLRLSSLTGVKWQGATVTTHLPAMVTSYQFHDRRTAQWHHGHELLQVRRTTSAQ